MTPEDIPRGDIPERLARLERTVTEHGADIARIQSDVSNNTQMIRALAPLISQLATVAEAQRNLERAVESLRSEWRDDVSHFDGEIEKLRIHIDKDLGEITNNQAADQRDSRNYRRMLIGIGIAAVLSPIGTLIVAVVQGQ